MIFEWAIGILGFLIFLALGAISTDLNNINQSIKDLTRVLFK